MENLLNNQELRVAIIDRLNELKLPLVPFNPLDSYSVKLWAFMAHGAVLVAVNTDQGIVVSATSKIIP